MAMNLTTAEADIKTAVQDAAYAKWGTAENGYAAFAEFAEVIAKGVVEGLQHIIDNAETDPGGESIK